jgi:hypothetical protein
MRKPTFYCCLKHCRIKAQANRVQVTDDFCLPGTKDVFISFSLIVRNVRSAIKKTKLVSWLSYVCRFQTNPGWKKQTLLCHGLH